jgi:hypothetical protein
MTEFRRGEDRVADEDDHEHVENKVGATLDPDQLGKIQGDLRKYHREDAQGEHGQDSEPADREVSGSSTRDDDDDGEDHERGDEKELDQELAVEHGSVVLT